MKNIFDHTSAPWIRYSSYESVYLPKNHFIKAETLSTEEYLSYFYPFDKPNFRKNRFTHYRMGLPFPANHGADVLFLHTHG